MDVPMHTFVFTPLFQTFDIQVFNTNGIIIVDIRSGELMEETVSLIIDSLINLVQLIPKLPAIVGALLSSR